MCFTVLVLNGVLNMFWACPQDEMVQVGWSVLCFVMSVRLHTCLFHGLFLQVVWRQLLCFILCFGLFRRCMDVLSALFHHVITFFFPTRSLCSPLCLCVYMLDRIAQARDRWESLCSRVLFTFCLGNVFQGPTSMLVLW